MLITVLMYIVILMQLGDLVLTYLAIRAGAKEANPLLDKLRLVLPGKWTWLFITKLGFVVLVYWAVGRYGQAMEVPLSVLIAIYGYVLWSNYRVLRQQRAQKP